MGFSDVEYVRMIIIKNNMIYESYYWKNELYSCYKYLIRYRNLKVIREISSAKVEKYLMIGAFIIRKLIDADKIPKEFVSDKIDVVVYHSKGNNIDKLNWHHINENYFLNEESKQKYEWKFIINQFIHSYTFILAYDEFNQFDGVVVNSDHNKSNDLLLINLKDIIKLYLKITEGSIVETEYKRQNMRDKYGEKIIGSLIQTSAKYIYPNGFDLDTIVETSMKGKIYKRKTSS
jgi:hypothetical protein